MRCEREGEDVPEAELEYSDQHGWVHKRGRWHTLSGKNIDAGTIPGPLTERFDPEPPPES